MEQIFNVREALREDCETILTLMKDFGSYLDMSDLISVDVDTLRKALFDDKAARTLIAEVDGKPMGYAMFCYKFSSFSGAQGLFLEDLYIAPEHRGKGFGKALIKELFDLASNEGYPFVEWECLTTNVKAQEFYKSIGAKEKGLLLYEMELW